MLLSPLLAREPDASPRGGRPVTPRPGDREERAAAIKRHVTAIKAHIDTLADKGYHALTRPKSYHLKKA